MLLCPLGYYYNKVQQCLSFYLKNDNSQDDDSFSIISSTNPGDNPTENILFGKQGH